MELKQWIKENLFDAKQRVNSNKAKKSWFENNGFTNEYHQIMAATPFLRHDSRFAERIFCILNDIKLQPTCMICSKPVNFEASAKKYPSYCSQKCVMMDPNIRERMQSTTIARYGVANPMQADQVKGKVAATVLEKYGVDNAFKSEEIKQRIKERHIQKYGVEHHMQSDVIKTKVANTNKNRYGAIAPIQNKKVMTKIKSTNLEKYGVDNPWKNKEVRGKIKTSNLLLYGAENPMQNKEIAAKAQETRLKKYGQNGPCYKPLPINEIEKDYLNGYTLKQLADRYDVAECTIALRLREAQIEIRKSYKISAGETEIFDWLVGHNIEADRHNRTIIRPKELDILIKSHNLAIEYCGLYWHSDSNNSNRNFHLHKLKDCIINGYTLVTIFENEWQHKQDLVKSIISQKLGNAKRTIHARDCIVKSVSANEAKTFLEANHIQGSINASVKLGLFKNDELVSLMTFGKSRFNKEYQYEMYRYCNKLYTKVHGGASKLFKFFINNCAPISIISYSDKRYFTGQLYIALGFTHINDTNPNYWYFRHPNTELHSRVKFQKHKLHKLLEKFDPTLSEYQNMLNHGFMRIWDCGNSTWSWCA